MPEFFAESIVWGFREENLSCYNVYGLEVTNNGTITAFAEGRLERWDVSPHHIVMKRSVDGGATWGPTQYLVESRRGECYCNPTPLVERLTGRIFLFYARNDGQVSTEVFYIISVDDGVSWSTPAKVTALFSDNPHGWTFHLPGPGHGIQLAGGRLVLQVWHRRAIDFPADERRYGVSVIYSDDAGETWRHGGVVPLGGRINESRIVQLGGGELLLNARSGPFVTSRRHLSRSRDEGATWTPPRPDSLLPSSYATDAGLVMVRSKSEHDSDMVLLLLSRPAGRRERINLTVAASDDEGASWKFERTIYREASHYSDLVALPDEGVGLLYGRGSVDAGAPVEGNVREVAFAKFSLGWLTDTSN